MAKIGIGIITYNRLDYLRRCVERVRRLTPADHALVVADDGSTDGTADWCRDEGIVVVGRGNRGVCWNKNRALFALQALGCDPILLMEDDCSPVVEGWEESWRVATALFGHVSYAHPKLARWQIAGRGTPTDPIVNNKSTAQCASISGDVLRRVGFFDTRFRGYGVGHAEWTTRVKRAGHGFKYAILENGARARANLYIDGGIEATDAPTFKDPATIRRNEALFDALKAEPVYRHPWRGPEEEAAFAADFDGTPVGIAGYAAAFRPDRADAGPDAAVEQILYHGATRAAVGELLGDEASVARRGGWLASVASGVPCEADELSPGFTDAANHLLRRAVRPEWRVLHLGDGYAAAWWADRVAAVTAVTTRPEVAAAARWSGVPMVVAADDAVARGAVASAGTVQVLAVAERCGRSFLRGAVAKLAPDGVALVAGSAAKTAVLLREELGDGGFRALELAGLVPGGWQRDVTTVFYRANNCLGL